MCVVDCVLNLIARHVSWCVRARVSFSLCVRKCVCVYSTLIISSYTLDRKLIWHESKIKLKTKWKTQLLKHKHTFLFHIYIEHLSSHLPPHTDNIYTMIPVTFGTFAEQELFVFDVWTELQKWHSNNGTVTAFFFSHFTLFPGSSCFTFSVIHDIGVRMLERTDKKKQQQQKKRYCTIL